MGEELGYIGDFFFLKVEQKDLVIDWMRENKRRLRDLLEWIRWPNTKHGHEQL